MNEVQKARELLRQWKGDTYAFGLGVLGKTGEFAAELGKTAMVIANRADWMKPTVDRVVSSLKENGASRRSRKH
jgi:alcohol dehydrogenase